MAPTGQADDRGETLVELLVAVMIMGIAVVAVVGGLGTSILVSDMHRKQAVAGAHVRAYAEAIEKMVASTGYVTCATTSSYASANPVTEPGYVAEITAVRYWSGSLFSTTCAPATDSGVQRVSVQVRSTDNRATESLDVIIRKPCRPTDALCA